MLNSENSILFIIDIQDKLVRMLKNSEEIAKNNYILTKTATLLGIPIIASEQYPQGLGSTIPDIRSILTDENVFEKTSFNAYSQENIKTKLDNFNRKKVIMTGIETHICVYQTAISLLEAGYEVYIVKNACSSRKSKDYKTALNLMHDYGAKLTCVETVLFELLGSSTHPHFKEIQSLIK